MRRLGSRAPRRAGGRWLAVLALGAGLAAGCAALRRDPLDVPPGHQVILGGVYIAGFSELQLVLDIVREDGTYQAELPVGTYRNEFVITLPRGRYQVTRLRVTDSGRLAPKEVWFRINATFEVGDAAVYVGTLQIERVVFATEVRIAVQDEYERTVPAMRARYPEIPQVIARAPMRPS